jgi:hypothetical protein
MTTPFEETMLEISGCDEPAGNEPGARRPARARHVQIVKKTQILNKNRRALKYSPHRRVPSTFF